jgi:hypothetical protein
VTATSPRRRGVGRPDAASSSSTPPPANADGLRPGAPRDDYHPIPLSTQGSETVVDVGIQRTLAPSPPRPRDVLLASHDGGFIPHVPSCSGSVAGGGAVFREFLTPTSPSFDAGDPRPGGLHRAFNAVLPRGGSPAGACDPTRTCEFPSELPDSASRLAGEDVPAPEAASSTSTTSRTSSTSCAPRSASPASSGDVGERPRGAAGRRRAPIDLVVPT